MIDATDWQADIEELAADLDWDAHWIAFDSVLEEEE